MLEKLVIAGVGVGAVMFAVFGLWALASPEGMAGPLGIDLGGRAGRTEWRAMYGGFELALAALLAWSAFRPDLRGMGLVCCTVMLAGLGTGRIIGIVAEGGADPIMWKLVTPEIVGTAIGAALIAARARTGLI